MRDNCLNILDGCFQKGKFSTGNLILKHFVAVGKGSGLLTLESLWSRRDVM